MAVSAITEREAHKWTAEGGLERERNFVAEEVPLALIYNGEPFSVMMVTPADLDDFVLGFSLTENIIKVRQDIDAVEFDFSDKGISAYISVHKSISDALTKRKKNLVGRTGCGICGAFPFIAGMSTTMANMGIIYTSSPIFIIFLSVLFFKDRINFSRVIGLILCLTGVLVIICKGDLSYLINFKFTSGDLWMLGAAIGWAIYSIFLINWKSNFSLMARFTLIAFFGAISLFPFYLVEESYFFNTTFNNNFIFINLISRNFLI